MEHLNQSDEFGKLQKAILAACGIPSIVALNRQLLAWREYYETNIKKILEGVAYADIERWKEKFHHLNECSFLGAGTIRYVDSPVKPKIIRGFAPES
jgi:hypothetical protein